MVDVARGLVIVGVVFNHAVDGLIRAGIIRELSTLGEINAALYVFRMPALAFLLGLFVAEAIKKYGWRGYLIRRVSLMLYLYLLWYVIQGVAEVATSNFRNSPRTFGSLWTVWVTFAHLWFLPFLVVATTVLVIGQPWRSPVRGVIFTAVLLTVSLALWGWNSAIVGLTGLSLLYFVAAGSCLGLGGMRVAISQPLLGWVVIGALAAMGFVGLLQFDLIPSTVNHPASLSRKFASLLAANLGVVVVIAVAATVNSIASISAPLARIGRTTLSIFLAHVIVVAGMRIVLLNADVRPAAVYLIAAVLAGVLIPLLVSELVAPRRWASWIFDLPLPAKPWIDRISTSSSGR